MVTSLKYLGQVILAEEDDWQAVVKNLLRAKKVWSRILCILSREGAAQRVSGFFFKSILQAVLLFRAYTWVVAPRMGKALGGFQTQVARRMTVQILQRTPHRKWRYTLVAYPREEVRFLTME